MRCCCDITQRSSGALNRERECVTVDKRQVRDILNSQVCGCRKKGKLMHTVLDELPKYAEHNETVHVVKTAAHIQLNIGMIESPIA